MQCNCKQGSNKNTPEYKQKDIPGLVTYLANHNQHIQLPLYSTSHHTRIGQQGTYLKSATSDKLTILARDTGI